MAAVAEDGRDKSFVGDEDDEMDMDVECCKHTDISRWKLLCITCIEYICYRCVFFNHKDHDVVPKDNIQGEIQRYVELIRNKLAQANTNIDSLNMYPVHSATISIIDQTRKSIAEYFGVSREQISAQHKAAVDKLNKLDRSSVESSEGIQNELDECSKVTNRISVELDTVPQGDAFKHLRWLKRNKTQLDELIKRTDSTYQDLKGHGCSVQFWPSSLSFNVAALILGPLVGAIRINDLEVIFVYDERNSEQHSVRLSCVAVTNTTTPTWSNVVSLDESVSDVHRPPVVICKKLPTLNDQTEIFIGCGRRIYTAVIESRKNDCRLSGISSKAVNLSEGSILKSLNWVHSDVGLFATESLSTSIMRLDKDLSIIERIECEEICENALCFDKGTVAFMTTEEVKIRDDSERPCQVLPQPDEEAAYVPEDIMFDGTVLSVLWVSDKAVSPTGQTYRVTTYTTGGAKIGIVLEGKCPPGVKAVCMSHILMNAHVCLSNGHLMFYNSISGYQ